jgi:hypothetical protein
MSFTKDSAAQRAVEDISKRLGISESEVSIVSISDKEFPDMSLGANVAGEMAAQMISSGWSINLEASGNRFEYRADKYQLRLCSYKGTNHIVVS